MIEVFFFGCTSRPGHGLEGKITNPNVYKDIPWGVKIDTGLLQGRLPDVPDGNIVEDHRDGWTAISFWDRSGGDVRGGSNSAFLAHADLTVKELLTLAKEQWPEIFSRPGFPLKPDGTYDAL